MTSFSERLAELAAAQPDAPAVTDDATTLTRSELDRLSNRWARALEARGVAAGDVVSVCLPSDHRFLAAAWAVWKAGATPQPLSPRMVDHELREVVELTQPALVLGRCPEGLEVPTWDLAGDEALSDAPVPARVSRCWKAPVSGGSTGRPKVILSTSPAEAEPLLALAAVLRLHAEETVLLPAPLHHNGPFMTAALTVLQGGHAVLMTRFEPVRALELVARHRVGWVYAVPTIMSRIAKLPPEVTSTADLSSVRTLLHMAAPCAEWLKRWWIDRLGPDAVWELYAGTEVQAITLISGTEWLTHPGSVGRPVAGEMRVLGEDGAPAPAGEVGEVFMRSTSGPTYRYLGATAVQVDGWESLGDMGWMDPEGYLYLGDRKSDMVLVGGVNVYPAEVEATLEAHPAVESACVVGLPDDDLGNRLHAVVHLTAPLTDGELTAYLGQRLAPHKRPRSFERSEHPVRDDAGKVRRSAVRERSLTGGPGPAQAS